MGKRNYEQHGYTGTRVYRIWKSMKSRCTLETNTKYSYYGGRGITVCDNWLNSFISFLNDMGEPSPEETIDRIDTNEGYYRENCRWVSMKEQAGNRRAAVTTKAVRLIDTAKVRYVIKKGHLNKFCETMGLQQSCMSRVLRGQQSHHKGWTGQWLS